MAFYGTPYSSTWDYDFAPSRIQAYSSSPYESGEYDSIDYNSTSYYNDDYFVTPSELDYSAYVYSEPEILQYEPIQYHNSYDHYESSVNPYHSSYNYYDSSINPSEVNYSVYKYSEPKLLQYEPPGYFQSETKFTISYSTAEFNEPEFVEYDPTPYGGGYDPVTTYGKPLPPSDITCYPRSLPKSDTVSPENFSYSSIPSPYGKSDDLEKKPVVGTKPVETKPVDTKIEPKTHVENEDDGTSDESESSDDEIAEPLEIIPTVEFPVFEKGFDNGTRGGNDYECEKQVSRIPYGSGLESIDLCESLFGYWPCLAKIEQQKRRERSQACDHERRTDPWETAADYLFGNPLVYQYDNFWPH